MEQHHHCKTQEDSYGVAVQFLDLWFREKKNLYHPPILLEGVVGAGKSTFTKYCLQYLALLDATQTFTSPSFGLINEYYPLKTTKSFISQITPPVFHIDLYRLHSAQEAENIGLFDIINNHLCFIEWPERISLQLNSFYYHIKIEIISETARKIIINTLLK